MRLHEIDRLRPIVIVLLIIMHSFTMYSGHNSGWPLPEGISAVKGYWWIQQVTYSCILELFTFISGYVYAFALYGLHKNYSFVNIIKSKTQRLLVPCIVFGVFYSLLLNEENEFGLGYIYNLLNGFGHLWYLTMLFEIFVFIFLLERIVHSTNAKMLILIMLSIISFLIPNYLQIAQTAYFSIFFFIGTICFQNKEQIKLKLSLNKVAVSWLVFLVVFVNMILLKENINEIIYTDNIYYTFVLREGIKRLLTLFYSILGVTSFWMTSLFFSTPKTSSWILWLNRNCFGAYLFHQILLQYFYYKTSMPLQLGTYLLPFVAFVITLPSSLLLSDLFSRIKFINKII